MNSNTNRAYCSNVETNNFRLRYQTPQVVNELTDHYKQFSISSNDEESVGNVTLPKSINICNAQSKPVINKYSDTSGQIIRSNISCKPENHFSTFKLKKTGINLVEDEIKSNVTSDVSQSSLSLIKVNNSSHPIDVDTGIDGIQHHRNFFKLRGNDSTDFFKGVQQKDKAVVSRKTENDTIVKPSLSSCFAPKPKARVRFVYLFFFRRWQSYYSSTVICYAIFAFTCVVYTYIHDAPIFLVDPCVYMYV